MARRAPPVFGTFEERCLAQANRIEREAEQLPPGELRDDLLRNARQIKIASELDKWLASPGLRRPT